MDNKLALDASIELEELMCQLSVWLDDVRVGDLLADLTTDRERMRKMKELLKKIPKDDQHPIVQQLFNWLSYPHRSADDFISVVDQLRQNCEEDFGCRICLSYFGKVFIQALAIRNQTLENSWEHAALVVINFYDKYGSDEYTISPDYLSAWIICVTGDTNICLTLRIKLISLFNKLAFINDHNWDMAFQSVMFACSSLNIENENDFFLMMSTSVIIKIFEVFSKHNTMFDFDHKLCKTLQDAKKSQLSAILHDVSYTMRMNSNRNIEPKEVKGLIALFSITEKYAQREYKALKEGRILSLEADHIEKLEEISGTLRILISSFTMSCQTPQLIVVTASCFMDVVELILHAYESNPPTGQEKVFNDCEQSLITLFICGRNHFNCSSDPRDLATSPIGREIINNFSRRLGCIRSKIEHHESFKYYYPTIHDLLFLTS